MIGRRYLLPQSCQTRGRTVQIRGGDLDHAWVDRGEDLAFTPRHGNKPSSMFRLFDRLREAGIEPHPFGQDADGAVVADLNQRLKVGAVLDTDGLQAGPLELTHGTASRPRYFGVDRAQFPIPRLSDRPARDESTAYGSYLAVMEDVAALGASLFREPVTSDLIWHHVFPEQYNGRNAAPGEIPEPADILENLRADDFSVLWRFNLWLCAAIANDVQIFPTVFARGGGEGLNSDPHTDKDATIYDPTVQIRQPDFSFEPAQAPDGTSWQDCIDGKPAHQNSVLIPSVWGWNKWYWNAVTMGVPDGGTSSQYQHYALNVYNPDATDPDEPARIDTYDGMAAVRKSLAVAAFGLGIGEFLAAWDAALRDEGAQLSDYVPHLEFGAENDEQWARLELVKESVTALSQRELDALNDDPVFRASYREYARFHAVLARSIHVASPGILFKASELSSWATIGQSAGRSLWLGLALTTGLDAEDSLMQQVIFVQRLGSAWVFMPGFERAEDWVSVARDAQFRFPSILFTLGTAAPAVSIVGFHWFHYWERSEGTGDWGYQNEAEAWDDTVEPFLALVQGACAAAGRPVTWGVGNVGFPSEYTDVVDATGHAHDTAYYANTQMVQAQTLVRLFLAFIGWGAQNALWFCHMSDKRPYSSGEFATMAPVRPRLHHDHVARGEHRRLAEGVVVGVAEALDALRQCRVVLGSAQRRRTRDDPLECGSVGLQDSRLPSRAHLAICVDLLARRSGADTPVRHGRRVARGAGRLRAGCAGAPGDRAGRRGRQR